MILLPLLLAAAPAPAAIDCAALLKQDPARALDVANGRILQGGGFSAKQCAALAFAALGKWPAAAAAFEQAAHEADRDELDVVGDLWVQAGNAHLAAGQAREAVGAFDAALLSGRLSGLASGETHLDRARAQVALGRLPEARIDMDDALRLVPQDPLAWLLSASLARRMGDLDRAGKDIGEASRLSPDDASVALEAGRIALASGSADAARVAFEGAIKVQPGSEAAQAAQAELDRLKGAAQRK
ncbi:tetratricopeptide repeat protein [Sphingomonas sp. MAH-20]|uniref:Tetratricopeptide repeat protein n=1 Tax=Sphingomonas horti TaxID=2682842 RepID=A0A6I4IXL8_9SPHN|nr:MULTISPECIES: tetratricopeptide repeat protein [Sphingomonas]MBA2920944.1 tetratricopeptide repeat protein [Sphingomonas sp. CGMCC 1.13658]MVO76930.1 tetratricopeptide repeat protein [Sphingomonas horti]